MAGIKRSVNFSPKEEYLLLSLAKKYTGVLENKKTDNNMNKQKVECWKLIEREFNNESGQVFRDNINLRNKYENLKKRSKKKFADEKCYALGTGGGPAKKPAEISDLDFEIKEILGERLSGLPSNFGGDAENITIINEPADNSFGDLTKNIYEDVDEDSYIFPEADTVIINADETNDESLNKRYSKIANENLTHKPEWSRNTVQNLRTPISKPLILADASTGHKRRRNEYDAMCGKVSHWAASKSVLESNKLRLQEEEHAIKINLMKEKFELESELMKKESEARIKKIETEMEETVNDIRETRKLKRDILLLEKHVLVQKLKNTCSK